MKRIYEEPRFVLSLVLEDDVIVTSSPFDNPILDSELNQGEWTK